jgi:predicted cobalt transporter CbtA
MKRNLFEQQGSLVNILTSVLRIPLKLFKGRWQKKLPLYFFLGLCFNLVLAPVVFASTSSDFRDLSRAQIYWLAGLIPAATGLSIYLFILIFAPEKF